MEIVLVIESDPAMLRFLQRALSRHELLTAQDAETGVYMAVGHSPDLILLSLSEATWSEVVETCTRLRQSGPTPIIVLSPATDPADDWAVEALDVGADDYMRRPFDVGELSARVRARLRRPALEAAHNWGSQANLLRSNDGYLTLYIDRRRVCVGSQDVRLSKTEFALLLQLMRHAGKVLTYQWLLQQIWGPAYSRQEDYVRVYVHHLRQKVEQEPSQPQYILTENGLATSFARRECPASSLCLFLSCVSTTAGGGQLREDRYKISVFPYKKGKVGKSGVSTCCSLSDSIPMVS